MGQYEGLLSITRNLGFRLGLLLTVAILPIGMISIIQTLNLSREAERSAEVALLGRTATAAAGERALLQNAIASADALAPAVLATLRANNLGACTEMMRQFIERGGAFAYAGFTDINGINACSSTGDGVLDARDTSHYQQFIRNPGTMITSSERGRRTNQPVVIVSQPLYDGRVLLGFIALSMTQDLLRSTHSPTPEEDGTRITTFNADGQVIASNEDVDSILPQGQTLASLVRLTDTTFAGIDNRNESRVFSVVPVVPGLVYALGSWAPKQSGIINLGLSRFTAILFPIVLWAVSLAVAYFAVYRLVLRHVRELRGQMRRFAIGDRTNPPPVLTDAPAEITDVSETLHNMARILIRDEKAMEAAVQEKTVLLKEVHHRVKNNLQLIASIINMQSRVIDDADAKRVLRSVQDRVTSLATIYRNLYQAEHLDAVDADRLVADIIQQMGAAALDTGSDMEVSTELEPLRLLPDQAVPLSLLTNEAFTNALKYAGPPAPGEKAWVRVTLRRLDEGHAGLTVENSLGESDRDMDGTGLGSQLIEAFVMQLEGEASTTVENGVFRLQMRFPPEGPARIPAEESRPVVLTSAARQGATH